MLVESQGLASNSTLALTFEPGKLDNLEFYLSAIMT